MDLGWPARSPSSPARARASGWPSPGRSSPRAPGSSPARRRSAELTRWPATATRPAVAVDLAAPDGPAELVDAAVAARRLDILVNNVGAVHPRLDGFLAVTDDEWQRDTDLNFLAAVRTTRAALPHHARRGHGHHRHHQLGQRLPARPGRHRLQRGQGGADATSARRCRRRSGPRGIRVNTVSPGPVETDLWLGDHGVAATVGGANNLDPRAVVKQAAAGTSTGRFTRPDEVADLVVLLASSRAANITGSDFLIDGGLVQTL